MVPNALIGPEYGSAKGAIGKAAAKEDRVSRMNIFARLFRPRPDKHSAIRPLWHRIVEIAREKQWYATLGIADTLPGRFDTITLVLALVLLRMEGEADLASPSVRLTELFVDDMDGQLRESGVGDVVVGKHIGRLVSVLGGRLGALREALSQGDDEALTAALTRNITMRDGVAVQTQGAAPLATAIRALANELAALPGERLLAGDIPR